MRAGSVGLMIPELTKQPSVELLGNGISKGEAMVATISWSGIASSTWNTATNWSGGIVPTRADTVIIGGTGTYTVTAAVPAEVGTPDSERSQCHVGIGE